jgi:uncharacterized cupredoxin-like copper-binding protein
MSFASTHVATLLRYGGISFIAGAVNHGMFSETRSAITAAFGVVFYLVGSWLDMRLQTDEKMGWADVLGVGIVSSVGLGFFTGGLQHFPDSPDRSVWVVPLGFVLSLVAMYWMAWRSRTSVKSLLVYGVLSCAVVVGASFLAWDAWKDQASGGHDHGAAHGESAHDHAHDHAPKPSTNAAPTRTVTLTLGDDMRFSPANWQATAGETVRIEVVNLGKMRHELVLGTEEDLKAHAQEMKQASSSHKHHGPNVLSLAAGERGVLTWTFTDAGVVHMACFEPGHYDAGMRGTISVLP